MKKLILLSIVTLCTSILFAQELTTEQEYEYNNKKNRIETNKKITGLGTSIGTTVGVTVGSFNEEVNYFIYKGYDEISVEELALNFGDEEKYQSIVDYKNKFKLHKNMLCLGLSYH